MILALVWTIQSYQYQCQFDKHKVNVSHSRWEVPEIRQLNLYPLRHLQSYTRSTIRITQNFNKLQLAVTNTTIYNYIVKCFEAGKAFFILRLKVYRLSSNIDTTNYDSYCSTLYTLPTSDTANGVANSDLHIYVDGFSDSNNAAVATGLPCNFVSSPGVADVTKSAGRPVLGLMRFNYYRLNGVSITPVLYAGTIATVTHQFTHILGFGQNYFPTWLDTATGLPYNSPTVTKSVTRNSVSKTITMLATPNIKAWARAQYGCNTLDGMQLQNQGGAGTLGSHWQRLVAYDQTMTATQLGAVKAYSKLTFAALKDMTWYDVDDTYADSLAYGFGRGCNFFDQGCFSGSYPQYCSSSGTVTCSHNTLGKGSCTLAANVLADDCTISVQTISCIDSNSYNLDGIYSYSSQTYGTSSACFSSSAATVTYSNYNVRCYRYSCKDDNSELYLYVGSNTFTCSTAGATISVPGMSGQIICPDLTLYCVNRRILCPNFCNGNGICSNGYCNCKSGYAGVDCSIDFCSSSQYYSPLSGTCVATCPSTYYNNIYNRNCQKCSNNCNQCIGPLSTQCSACPNGVSVLHLGNCISACPTGFYNNTGSCSSCDGSCLKCSGNTASSCTACSSPNFLWSLTANPTVGTCQTTCSGTNNHADYTNRKCGTSCPYNQIKTNTADANKFDCNMCSAGQFYNTGTSSCVGSSGCTSGFFARTSDQFCAQCYSTTCLTCSDTFSTNCTSCQSNFPYLYLGSCVISTDCGFGTYPNDSLNPKECTICPTGCLSCTSSTVCTSCISPTAVYTTGYFLKNNGCVTSCLSTQYTNPILRVCSSCDSSCATCISGAKAGCSSCSGSSYLYTNSSGTFCLQMCPSIGYYPDPSNVCISCYPTCYTCSGSASTNCYSCSGSLFLNSGQCIYFCPMGLYRNSSNNICTACDKTCSYCNGYGPKACVNCAKGLYLNSTECLASCPNQTSANAYGVCWGNWILSVVLTVMALI